MTEQTTRTLDVPGAVLHYDVRSYTHYSLLRTIETAWGLAPLTASDGAVTPMTGFFPVG